MSGTSAVRFVRSALVAVVLAAIAPVVVAAQATGAPRHTEADTKFMQGMIHHHAQAVMMAALVPTRSARKDLAMLAQRIDVSQVDEIEWMRTWLSDRGEMVPAALTALDAHAGHDAGHAAAPAAGAERPSSPMMPGMLSADAMAALERASAAEFDRLFLEGMIRHHEGAIVMVARLFASPGAGQESMIFGFASDVDADQRAEIARMRRLLVSMPPAK